MGYWSFHFFAKVGLYWAHVIDFHVWPNLVFALLLCIPLPPGRSWVRTLRNMVATAAAVGLFWYDSDWPGPSRLIEQWSELSQFSGNYWLELLGRVLSWQIVAALLLGAAAYSLLKRRVRMGMVAIALMAVLSWLPWPHPDTTSEEPAVASGSPEGQPASAPAPTLATPRPVTLVPAVGRDEDAPLDNAQLDQVLSRFYETEQHRGLKFAGQRNGTPPFDLLILSVCSLSWDDLSVAGLDNAPLLRRMDLLFRQFNSAASYSGPAVLRLLHGTCGQTPQAQLYDPAPPECYLFEQLDRLGYRSTLLLNHDGRYDGFAEQVKNQGGINARPADHTGAQIALYGFDGSPIYDDYDVLSRWWRGQTDGATTSTGAGGGKPVADKRMALFYNTITLHDGNRKPGQVAGNTLKTWPDRARKLFSDLERMLALVEQSGRPTVVVLVPEHGAGLRGDNTQIPGLREFPTPRITHVPAGVALLNFGQRPAGAAPVMVDQVSSYNSLMAVVGALLERPASPWDTLGSIGAVLPSEEWVAENEGTVLLSRDGRNYVRSKEGRWTK